MSLQIIQTQHLLCKIPYKTPTLILHAEKEQHYGASQTFAINEPRYPWNSNGAQSSKNVQASSRRSYWQNPDKQTHVHRKRIQEMVCVWPWEPISRRTRRASSCQWRLSSLWQDQPVLVCAAFVLGLPGLLLGPPSPPVSTREEKSKTSIKRAVSSQTPKNPKP